VPKTRAEGGKRTTEKKNSFCTDEHSVHLQLVRTGWGGGQRLRQVRRAARDPGIRRGGKTAGFDANEPSRGAERRGDREKSGSPNSLGSERGDSEGLNDRERSVSRYPHSERWDQTKAGCIPLPLKNPQVAVKRSRAWSKVLQRVGEGGG